MPGPPPTPVAFHSSSPPRLATDAVHAGLTRTARPGVWPRAQERSGDEVTRDFPVERSRHGPGSRPALVNTYWTPAAFWCPRKSGEIGEVPTPRGQPGG